MAQQDFQNQELTLFGAEKAAALLLVMGKDQALMLADFFSRKEMSLITEAASRLNSLDVETVENLVSDFGKEYVGNGMFADPDNLSEFFKNFTSELDQSNDQEGSQSDIASSLSEAGLPDFEYIKEFIENESLLMSSFFVGTLNDELAAKLLSELEPDLRKKIFKKYLDQKTLSPKFKTLFKTELINLIVEQNTSDGSEEKIEEAARIINFFSEETGDDLVNFIESDDPDIAAIIKKSLFKFSSIVELSKPARSIIFDGIETDDIVKALGISDDKLKESVLETLSQRNRRMVESEMARSQATKDEIEACQRKIAGVALSLSKEGKISLSETEAV